MIKNCFFYQAHVQDINRKINNKEYSQSAIHDGFHDVAVNFDDDDDDNGDDDDDDNEDDDNEGDDGNSGYDDDDDNDNNGEDYNDDDDDFSGMTMTITVE